MRAWRLEDRSGPTGLSLSELPDPVPGPRDCLVEIAATALNRADLLQTRGHYPGHDEPAAVPGLEFSGRVLEVGSEVTRFGPGDAVIGLVAEGAWAERIAVREELLLALPPAADLVAAGGIAETALTVHDALRRQGGLGPGRTALVHAGSSGIGSAAPAIARELGARIALTVSTRKRELVATRGADLLIDYETEDVPARVREWTEGRGVDVVLDTLGGGALADNQRCLAHRGTMVVIGLLAGARGELDLGRLLTGRQHLIGSVLRSRSLEEKAALVAEFEAELGGALRAGRLAPLVDSVLPFARLPEGLERMRRREHCGKIVVDVAGS
ncbi:MAG: NAD(P)H-quinone oxidoreductase [Planctomycetota bacterium]